MDQNLFDKYKQEIQKQKSKKSEVCLIIKEKTGIVVNEEEIEITKKTVKIYTSSIKKNSLHSKKVQEILKQSGYTLL